MPTENNASPTSADMGLFERYLSVWVAIAIVAGIALGQFAPAVPEMLSRFEYAQVSIPIAVLIWAMIKISPRELLRQKGTPYDELKLDDPSLDDDQLIDAMMAHPILINRPIVVTPKGAGLCRPSERVLELLEQPVAHFTKEDGETIHYPAR
jgi:arsenate reductase (glutaredoxin)